MNFRDFERNLSENMSVSRGRAFRAYLQSDSGRRALLLQHQESENDEVTNISPISPPETVSSAYNGT